MKLTYFQALYIIWLRERCDCSWRSLSAHFYNRYDSETLKVKPMDKRVEFTLMTHGGNQLDGMHLESKAFELLGIIMS